jgi:hypothetical protein
MKGKKKQQLEKEGRKRKREREKKKTEKTSVVKIPVAPISALSFFTISEGPAMREVPVSAIAEHFSQRGVLPTE